MINHADIENIIGCKTLVTDRMQRAIEDWYDAAINGLPLDKNPETLTLDLPALICSELAHLTHSHSNNFSLYATPNSFYILLSNLTFSRT